MSSSRGFLKDNKVNRNSTKFGEGPLSSRAINDNRYPEPLQKTNFHSREFQSGIFTNELNRKAELFRKKEQHQMDLPLQIQEVEYKVRSSKKQNEYSRQSREESGQIYQPNYEFDPYDNKQTTVDIRKQLQKQMVFMWAEINSSLQSKIKGLMGEESAKIRTSINDIVFQTNNGFKKQQQALLMVKKEAFGFKQELGRLYKTYQTFSQQSQEKFQNIYMQIANQGLKRSKANGQYNMDIKSSFQGLNSSLSVNLGNENTGSKLVNEVIFQLDSQKKELNQTKALIEELTIKLNSKLAETKSNQKQQSKIESSSASKQEIWKSIREALNDEKKKNKFDEKIQALENIIKEIQIMGCTQEQNIKGINDEFANSVNNQINPKIKKIQTSLVDIYSRIDPSQLEVSLKAKICSQLDQKLKDTRVLKIRNCSKQECAKMSILSGNNENKITYKETYLLDQENYLLDSEGTYLVQETNNKKQKIKIDNNMVYLLQLRGIEIANTC